MLGTTPNEEQAHGSCQNIHVAKCRSNLRTTNAGTPHPERYNIKQKRPEVIIRPKRLADLSPCILLVSKRRYQNAANAKPLSSKLLKTAALLPQTTNKGGPKQETTTHSPATVKIEKRYYQNADTRKPHPFKLLKITSTIPQKTNARTPTNEHY